MAQVIEIVGENSFKSSQEIIDFNKQNFPREPEQTREITVGNEDPMAALRSQMKQRIYSFSTAAKDSSSMKVAEFKTQFLELKEKIQAAKAERKPEEKQPTSYATLVHQLYCGADLVSNIEGRIHSHQKDKPTRQS